MERNKRLDGGMTSNNFFNCSGVCYLLSQNCSCEWRYICIVNPGLDVNPGLGIKNSSIVSLERIQVALCSVSMVAA
jgi:hypothetical protein